MLLQNLHTHTVYGDGKNTAEEMVLGAIRAGCASLGFSEHSPLPPAADPDGWSMAASDVAAYRAELLRLRERYRGELDIFLGLEQDVDSPAPEGDWDYLIGSVHSVRADGRFLSVDESPESFARSVREHFGGDSLARGYRTALYPAPFLLRTIREKGGRVCITSDSHSESTVTCAFDRAADLAAECGFRETWILTAEGFRPAGLEELRRELARS